MWSLFLVLLPSISRCAPPFSQELKNCDDSGPRVSELSLNSALSTFLCYTEEEIGAMEEVEKKLKLAQKISPLFRYEHSYEDLVEKLIKMPSDSLVKIVNEVMNNRNAEIDHNTVEEYRSVFDEHIHLNNGLEDLERNGRNAFLSNFESWFSFGEGVEVSPNTATPQIVTSSQTFRVSVGDNVLLPCSVHNLGSLVPLWKHKQNVLTSGRQMVNPDTYKYQLVNDYNLKIRNIRAFDAGDYTCYITTLGQPVTLTHTIEIVGLVTDGGWSEWSAFSLCSATCGDATKSRKRTCTQPVPANGGKDCGELNEESVSCGLQTCGCPPDETITRECMCGVNSCAKGSVCASGSTCTLPDCKYRYPEVASDCRCRSLQNPRCILESHKCAEFTVNPGGEVCTTKGVCTNDNGCYSVCEPGKVTDSGCYCKEENSGELSQRPCPIGKVCLLDGHCHYDYEVSGVSTQPISASFGITLWTNQPEDVIKKMPEELINSILFRPKDLVAEATIQLSSPKDAAVFLALHEDQDGGLKDLLPKQDWKLKDDDEGNWVVEYMDYNEPNKGELKIWYQKIEENTPITFTTNEDGAKFVIFFSTDCEENLDAVGNCFCKNGNNDKGARHCKRGQGCKDGSCHDLPQKAWRK